MTEEDGKETISYEAFQPEHETLDRLIRVLGQLRANMSPPVKQDDPVLQTVLEAVDDPRLFVQSTSDGRTALSFRHPGFGWLSYLLTQQSRADLLRLLQVQTELPPPSPKAVH